MKQFITLSISVLFALTGVSQTAVWSTFVDTAVTFSSPRVANLNGDTIMDIVMGGGIDGVPDNRGVVAIDGETGNILWTFAAEDEIFGSAKFMDITGDGLDDVFIGGRYAEFYAINGATGNEIWEFWPYSSTVAADSGWYNFYNPQFIPDQNSDAIPDILVANGGDHAAPPWDTLRPAGQLMILDAMSGAVLAMDTMPDGEETYCSPILLDADGTGTLDIIYGSGGEDDGGSLWRVPLTDLLANDLSGSVILATDPDYGFIAPVSISYLNMDLTLDIVAQGFNGTIYAFDGGNNNPLWSTTIPGSQSSAGPVIGNFIGNKLPDVFAVLGKGTAPTYFDYYQVMLNGETGEIEWMDSISDLALASCASVDLDLNGRDELIGTFNYHTGTHFEHQIKAIDFQNDIITDLSPLQAGVNLGCTPLVDDIDNNGLVDIVYAYRADSTNPMGSNGFKVHRIETASTVPGVGISWGAYQGTNLDGHYNYKGSSCGTVSANLIFNNISCNGLNDANAVVHPAGGVEPYHVLWSNGEITDSIYSMPVGSYSVRVTDSTGCFVEQNFTVSDPYVLSWSPASGPDCPGGANGSATVSSSGCPCMFSGCTYAWSSIDSIKTASNLVEGWNYVTITHLDGCEVTDSIFVPYAPEVLDSIIVTEISCATDQLGAIDVYPVDTVNTMIFWGSGSGDFHLDSLSEGVYDFQAVNAAGCDVKDSVILIAPDTLVLTYVSSDALCFEDSTGSIDIDVMGGIPSYSYAWSDGQVVEDAVDLPEGYHSVTVLDSLGCELTQDSIYVGQPTAITSIIEGWNISPDSCEAEAMVSASGGTPGYTYLWDDLASTTDSLVGDLCAGTYIVEITDANGCVTHDTVTVSNTVGIVSNDVMNFSVYPNPNKGSFFVNNVPSGATIGVYDVVGKLIYQEKSLTEANNLELNLAPGKYLLRITLDAQVVTKTFVVE
jgi:hypothetical protein